MLFCLSSARCLNKIHDVDGASAPARLQYHYNVHGLRYARRNRQGLRYACRAGGMLRPAPVSATLRATRLVVAHVEIRLFRRSRLRKQTVLFVKSVSVCRPVALPPLRPTIFFYARRPADDRVMQNRYARAAEHAAAEARVAFTSPAQPRVRMSVKKRRLRVVA